MPSSPQSISAAGCICTICMCALCTQTPPWVCVCAVILFLCVREGARACERGGWEPDWKCDLIFINDNHMEHDCMIYSTTQKTTDSHRLEDDESRVLQNVAQLYWWCDTHKIIESCWKTLRQEQNDRPEFFKVKTMQKESEKGMYYCSNYCIIIVQHCYHHLLLFCLNNSFLA